MIHDQKIRPARRCHANARRQEKNHIRENSEMKCIAKFVKINVAKVLKSIPLLKRAKLFNECTLPQNSRDRNAHEKTTTQQ